MSEIYLVTVGSYECLEIIAAFEQRADAQSVADAIDDLPIDPTLTMATGAKVHAIPFNTYLFDVLTHVRSLPAYQRSCWHRDRVLVPKPEVS